MLIIRHALWLLMAPTPTRLATVLGQSQTEAHISQSESCGRWVAGQLWGSKYLSRGFFPALA